MGKMTVKLVRIVQFEVSADLYPGAKTSEDMCRMEKEQAESEPAMYFEDDLGEVIEDLVVITYTED